MAVLVLAVQAAAAGRAAARPWLGIPGGRRQVPASTARSWRSRFASHAAGLREQVMRLLPLASRGEAARPLAPGMPLLQFNTTLFSVVAVSPS